MNEFKDYIELKNSTIYYDDKKITKNINLLIRKKEKKKKKKKRKKEKKKKLSLQNKKEQVKLR